MKMKRKRSLCEKTETKEEKKQKNEITKKKKTESILIFIQTPNIISNAALGKLKLDKNTTILDYPAEEIAKQLTMIDWDLW